MECERRDRDALLRRSSPARGERHDLRRGARGTILTRADNATPTERPCRCETRRMTATARAKLCATAVLAFWTLAAPAHAAFPGGNGRLVWTHNAENVDDASGDYDLDPTLFTSDADGHNRSRFADDSQAAQFSPDGTRVAYVNYP